MQSSHSSPSLKEKHRQEREALILAVAEEVFLEKGYYEASMDEIAARVGIAKGTIYLHFPGKEELVVAIFQRDMHAFLQGIDNEIASMPTPRAKLEALLHFMYTGFFSKHTQLLSSLYNAVDMKRLLVEKGSCFYELWQTMAARVTQLLEDGKAAGEFDASIPTSVMAGAFFHLFAPRSYDRLLMYHEISPEDLAKYLGRVYFSGIVSKS